MVYVFDTSEATTSSGNRAETKSLLHLLCFDEDKDDIDAFAIDCFNDVTGMNNFSTHLYDVQSKATKKTSPKEIGRDLVTLFKNYISEFSHYFKSYTLFVDGVSSTVLTDKTLDFFRFKDVAPEAQKSIYNGLKEECSNKKYINDSLASDKKINDFLHEVKFALSKPSETDYIRPLVKVSSAIMPSSRRLQAIFNEIRNAQSVFKNKPSIVNKSIKKPDQVYECARVLERRKIELLIIQRVINYDIMKSGCPSSFNEYLRSMPPEDEDAILESCQQHINLQFFDKNSKEAFWELLDNVVSELTNDHDTDINTIFDRLDKKKVLACQQLNKQSVLYFIANIKDHLKL